MSDPRLEIEIIGHCMFATETGKLTVLMPRPHHPPSDPDDRHHARLKYCVLGADGKEEWKCGPLENLEVDFEPLGGDGFTEPDLSAIADIFKLTDQKLDRDLITSAAPRNVWCRVKITRGAGAPEPTPAVWDLPGHGCCVSMANRTKWTIPGITSTRLTLTGLHGEPDAAPLELEVINGVVKLQIEHVPHKEPSPQRGDFAEHFEHYYTLVPRFTGARVLPLCTSTKMPGHLLTCMHARAPVG